MTSTAELRPDAANRNIPLGYLRTFLTLLVVGHHAALAYIELGLKQASDLNTPPMIWGAFPIIDKVKVPGLELFVGLNDTYFMALLFLLAGFFTWPSLQRKGTKAYMRDRSWRLGLPFLLGALLLAPLAYFPSYLATGAAPSLQAYAKLWWGLSSHPAGPVWFLWVLLAFSSIASICFEFSPEWLKRWQSWIGRFSGRPILFFSMLTCLSSLAYIPMVLWWTPEKWVDLGIFWIQIGRTFYYFLYFAIGLGAQSFLSNGIALARRWFVWVPSALFCYIIGIALFIAIMSTLAKGGPSLGLSLAGHFSFTLSSAAISMAALAVFMRFMQTAGPLWDSLSESSYGIYLLHYVAVVWLQYGLLPVHLPAFAKFSIVWLGGVLLPWGLTILWRRRIG
jgi:hypothetical protein